MPPTSRRAVRRAVLITAVSVVALAGCASEQQPNDAAHETSGAEPATGSAGRLLEQTSADGHQLREVPADEAPNVRLEVDDDPDSGWNIHLDIERFTFAPEQVDGAARLNEGHAHLYLDGEKIARLYGPWHHLSASAVPEGEHTLMVQLNANDHTAWATDGAPVSAETTITSTGGDSSGHEHDDGDHEHDDPPDASGDPSPSATDAPDDTEETSEADANVQIDISGGDVSPAPGRTSVAVGDLVRIEVTSDQPDTIHIHGYDIEADVSATAPAVLEFTADQPGLFEVETHDAGLLLTQLVVE